MRILGSAEERKGQRLLKAVQDADMDMVQSLLATGANPLVKSADGDTALSLAIREGHEEIVAALCGQTLLIDECNLGLRLAALQGSTGIVKILVQGKANWKGKNLALIAAASTGELDVLRLLLDSGADVNGQDAQGSSPLSAACFGGHRDAVDLLLEHKADVNLADKSGATALMAATQGGYRDLAECLLKNGAAVDARTKIRIVYHTRYGLPENWIPPGTSALSLSVIGRTVDATRLLLDHGADVDIRDQPGWTPLMWASYLGAAEIARLLVQSGADVRAKSVLQEDGVFSPGTTPLMLASARGHLEVVELLLESGSDVCAADAYGNTALIYAGSAGMGIEQPKSDDRLEIAKLLLSAGANINHPNQKGRTVLFMAVLGNNTPLVEVLRKNGAEINAKCSYGYTPLSYARAEGYEELVTLLSTQGAIEPRDSSDLPPRTQVKFARLHWFVGYKIPLLSLFFASLVLLAGATALMDLLPTDKEREALLAASLGIFVILFPIPIIALNRWVRATGILPAHLFRSVIAILTMGVIVILGTYLCAVLGNLYHDFFKAQTEYTHVGTISSIILFVVLQGLFIDFARTVYLRENSLGKWVTIGLLLICEAAILGLTPGIGPIAGGWFDPW